jgi:hypothetical protein
LISWSCHRYRQLEAIYIQPVKKSNLKTLKATRWPPVASLYLTPCFPFRVSFDPEDLRIEGNPFRVNRGRGSEF